jgi:holo-[acyl-carrier protein] synthase
MNIYFNNLSLIKIRRFFMIIGIGTDLIEIERVAKACEHNKFLLKYYTMQEIKLYGTSPVKLAGNFAVKEAVSKMLGTGFRNIKPIEIEVLRDTLGKPYVNLYGAASDLSKSIGIVNIFVSVTNTRIYASAYVIGEGV